MLARGNNLLLVHVRSLHARNIVLDVVLDVVDVFSGSLLASAPARITESVHVRRLHTHQPFDHLTRGWHILPSSQSLRIRRCRRLVPLCPLLRRLHAREDRRKQLRSRLEKGSWWHSCSWSPYVQIGRLEPRKWKEIISILFACTLKMTARTDPTP